MQNLTPQKHRPQSIATVTILNHCYQLTLLKSLAGECETTYMTVYLHLAFAYLVLATKATKSYQIKNRIFSKICIDKTSNRLKMFSEIFEIISGLLLYISCRYVHSLASQRKYSRRNRNLCKLHFISSLVIRVICLIPRNVVLQDAACQ